MQRARLAQCEVIPLVDRGPSDIRVIWQLIRICRERKVRIWHAHDDKTNVLGLLVRCLVPLKLITTTHGWGANLGVNPWKAFLYKSFSRFALRHYHQSIAVSPNLFEILQQWGIPAKRRVLIENAIDTQEYRRELTTLEARQRIGVPMDGILLAALGRLSPEKGFIQLIEALRVVRDRGHAVRLVIGGEGSLRNDLTATIDRLKLNEYVTLLGHITDPRAMLQAADIFVLSSLNEGLPNVVLEAMALETTVVSTDLPGVKRVIRTEEHGLLVEQGNQSLMVDALCRLSLDSDLRRRLAKSARARIESQYDFGIRMQKVANLYDHVMGVSSLTNINRL